ncbi:hypothetical protein FGB62_384g02 [Gracilaria domingensis]|nr:hypothetical protein FGB62_384g02 [Gracilaria domingensis]
MAQLSYGDGSLAATFVLPNGREAFFACSFTDEDGWVWAQVANVTDIDAETQLLGCVSGQHTHTQHYVDVRVSWTQGPLDEFPQDLSILTSRNLTADASNRAFHVYEVKVLNESGLDCYLPGRVMAGDDMAHNGWCGRERKEQQQKEVTMYHTALTMDMFGVLNSTQPQRGQLENVSTTRMVGITYGGSLGFNGGENKRQGAGELYAADASHHVAVGTGTLGAVLAGAQRERDGAVGQAAGAHGGAAGRAGGRRRGSGGGGGGGGVAVAAAWRWRRRGGGGGAASSCPTLSAASRAAGRSCTARTCCGSRCAAARAACAASHRRSLRRPRMFLDDGLARSMK